MDSVQNKEYITKTEDNQRLTSQFAPKETQAVYLVPFSFSHRAPSDACRAPGSQHRAIKLKTLRY